METLHLATKAKNITFELPNNKWSDANCEGKNEQELLLYRSNLLGSDFCITNFGGGNTSAKISQNDPLTKSAKGVLWVKGSGGDLGSMKIDGFSTLYLEKLIGLIELYRGNEFEDEMVDYYNHCTFNLNPRATSIDTPLHAFLEFKHIDHVHPDAIIAIAASKNGEAVCNEIWGGEIGWLSWKRPGFELALRLKELVTENPQLRGVILENHGLICWGESSKSCYDNTLNIICDAARHLNRKSHDYDAFGGQVLTPYNSNNRAQKVAQIMPILKGLMSRQGAKSAHFSDSEIILQFVCSKEFFGLAQMGTSCPDHFLRTKIAPMVLDENSINDVKYLEDCIEKYKKYYADYYSRCCETDSPQMRDSNPIIVLIPRIGMISFAQDKTTARLASEFYINAINVMRGAQMLGGYTALDEKEAFDIEYWSLEEAKLQRMPKPKMLRGKTALITGGAGGIGAACARSLLEEGANVTLADIDFEALKREQELLFQEFGKDRVRIATCDVTDESQIKNLLAYNAIEFGGIDILVANAGIASSAPIEETDLEIWQKNFNVLTQGYFLVAKYAFSQMKLNGGSIVFIGSKNAVTASMNASAYSSAKAAALHFARCIALEGAPFGIRANTVNPDAVIKGSRIWSGEWRRERAQTFGIDEGAELEAHYKNRSMLKREVLPEDVAEAVLFFASEKSSKSTGNMINVDAGNAAAFPR